jgi:transformation/transcription domain-associated protein
VWCELSLFSLVHILEKSLKYDCLHLADEKIDNGRKLMPLLKHILADGEAEASTSEIITLPSTTATKTLSPNNYISGINLL